MKLIDFWYHDTEGFGGKSKLGIDWYFAAETPTKFDSSIKPRYNYIWINITLIKYMFNFTIRLSKTKYQTYKEYISYLKSTQKSVIHSSGEIE